MRKNALVVAFCLAVLPASAQDKAEFQKVADRFVEAYAKGDLNAVLKLYAEDASILPPQAPMAKGQSRIADFWKGEAQRAELKQVTDVDAQPLGNDRAHVIFTTVGRTRGQSPQEFQGKGTALVQKAGNEWKMLVHVWNRNDRDQ